MNNLTLTFISSKKLNILLISLLLFFVNHNAYATPFEQMSLAERINFYEQNSKTQNKIIQDNLLPFGTGSLQIEDYISTGLIAMTDSVAIFSLVHGIWSLSIPMSNTTLMLASIYLSTAIISYILGRFVGLISAFNNTDSYNSRLRNKLNLEPVSFSSQPKIVTTQLFSFSVIF
jgi:hypothetical protein